jgi:FkbM family methyltransferase
MEYYGQLKQDEYVHNKFFQGVTDGVYVDIGAHDGVSASNTLFFDKLGWKGVCVEPIKERFLDLENNRTSKNYNCVISDLDAKELEFCKIDGYAEMLSGIVENYTETHKQRILKECEEYKCNREKLLVENKKFSDIAPCKVINFLSVDTEGNEINIIESIDYDEYIIDVICFEDNNNFNIENSRLKKWYNIDANIYGQDIVLKRI